MASFESDHDPFADHPASRGPATPFGNSTSSPAHRCHHHGPQPPEYQVTGGFADTPVISAAHPPPLPHGAGPMLLGVPSEMVDGAEPSETGTVKPDDDKNTAPSDKATSGFCRLSLLALIGSGLASSGISAAGQYLVLSGFHSLQITIIRATGLVAFTLFQLSRSGEVPVPRDRVTGEFVAVGFCVLYGLIAVVDFGLIFMSAKWLPITENLAFWSLNPIFAAITARVWLKEPVSLVHVAGIFVFFGGAICAIDPPRTFGGGETSNDVWIGRGLAFCAAVLAGIRIVIPRRIFAAGRVSVLAPPFWMGLMGLLIPSAISFPMDFKTGLTLEDWPLYLAVVATAIGSFVAQSLLGYAMPRESGVVLGVLWNLFVVFSLFWQPVLFGIDPTMFQYISVALVLMGGAIVGTERHIVAALRGCCCSSTESSSDVAAPPTPSDA